MGLDDRPHALERLGVSSEECSLAMVSRENAMI